MKKTIKNTVEFIEFVSLAVFVMAFAGDLLLRMGIVTAHILSTNPVWSIIGDWLTTALTYDLTVLAVTLVPALAVITHVFVDEVKTWKRPEYLTAQV